MFIDSISILTKYRKLKIKGLILRFSVRKETLVFFNFSFKSTCYVSFFCIKVYRKRGDKITKCELAGALSGLRSIEMLMSYYNPFLL